MFTTMPYTNYQNLNLDWVLKQVKDIPNVVQDAVDKAYNNAFAYASYDPRTETLILKIGGAGPNELHE